MIPLVIFSAICTILKSGYITVSNILVDVIDIFGKSAKHKQGRTFLLALLYIFDVFALSDCACT